MTTPDPRPSRVVGARDGRAEPRAGGGCGEAAPPARGPVEPLRTVGLGPFASYEAALDRAVAEYWRKRAQRHGPSARSGGSYWPTAEGLAAAGLPPLTRTPSVPGRRYWLTDLAYEALGGKR